MMPKSVVLGGGAFQNAFCNRLLHQAGPADSLVRASHVMDTLDELSKVRFEGKAVTYFSES